MQLLVDTLLAIARNTVKSLPSEKNFLSQIVRDLVESLQVMSESKGIHIHIHTDLAEQRAGYILL